MQSGTCGGGGCTTGRLPQLVRQATHPLCHSRSHILTEEGCRGLMYSERYKGARRSDSLPELFPELETAIWGDSIHSKAFRSLKHLITTDFEAPNGSSVCVPALSCRSLPLSPQPVTL